MIKLPVPKEDDEQASVVRVLVLPFKLPTWNQLLAMNHWQRAKVTKWIKEQVFVCTRLEKEWLTRTESVQRLSLTELSLAEYSQMIQPSSSKKYLLAKRSDQKKKR